ncbi:DUF2937 family protein [Anianabacter salinae]|uniref:DUF2937 family protein n=1 Tax=Anianabacter salinae TaxID=2851023 RepID=UPI00225DE1F9|nr:DUF2937 family protein [Anianabacter salinae]MBV0913913.1 DUF2937 family protein [Anianabacter salinae]
MIKTLAMAGGLAGALAASQAPEFSQQYMQRLSGAVDELRAVALVVETGAAASGKTRDEALAELSRAGSFGTEISGTLSEQVSRYDRLSRDYQALREAEPLMRMAQVWRYNDPELLSRTWDDYRPGMPTTTDGLITAGAGFFAGWALVSLLLGGLARLIFGRRRRAA